MKYCLPYKKKYLKACREADEVIIKYNSENRDYLFNAFETLLGDKKIIIDFEEKNDKSLSMLIEDVLKLIIYNPNSEFVVRVSAFDNIKELVDKNIKVILLEDAQTWDHLHIAVAAGISEVVIGYPLAFELIKVKEFLTDKNILIRVRPNLCQGSKTPSSVNDFFIIPEDTKLYSDYVDTFEIVDLDKADIIYKIYKKEKWFGLYSEIITGLDSPIDGRTLNPDFGERRLRCGKRCIKGEKCRLCNVFEEQSEMLAKANVILIKKEGECYE